jgi:peptidyl-prolyl cis-trans isomerase C
MLLSLSPARRAAALALAFLLAVTLVLAGCGQDGNAADASDGAEDEEADDPITFTIGEPLDDSTLAVVVTSEYGTDSVTAQTYMQQISQFSQRIPPQQRDSLLPELHLNIVRQIAAQHVMSGEAEALELEADTAEVSQQIQGIIQRNFRGNRELFRQQLEQAGLTLDSLREMQAEQIRMRLLQEQYAEAADEPSAEEVADYREEQREEEVGAQHILFRVDPNAPEATVDSVRQVAEAILDSAQQGADFSALARRHSEGPSAPRGGDLGYFTRGRMVEAFDEAVFALEDSADIAPEPVRTRFGFHIIRLTGRRMQPAMDSTQAAQTLERENQREAVREALDELMSKATVRVNPALVEADLQAMAEERAATGSEAAEE